MEQKQIKELKMMDSSKWEVARIFHFTYPMLARPCQATLVYFRPFSDGINDSVYDEIDKLIIKALQGKFEDIRYESKNVVYEGRKGNIKQIYDGGRPHIKIIMNAFPTFNSMQFNEKQLIVSYQIQFRIFLNTKEKVDYLNDYFEIEFPVHKENIVKELLKKIRSL